MGKKAKTAQGKKKAATRKLPKSELPPPPKPLEVEVCTMYYALEYLLLYTYCAGWFGGRCCY